MSINKVTAGDNVPHEFNVIIEIPMNADPVKYEVDKDSGALFVDRFMMTAMHYPANYGYVPQTIADDDDPVDVPVAHPAGQLTHAGFWPSGDHVGGHVPRHRILGHVVQAVQLPVAAGAGLPALAPLGRPTLAVHPVDQVGGRQDADAASFLIDHGGAAHLRLGQQMRCVAE